MRSVSCATVSGQDLQRDVAPELGIACAIHLTHAAGADRRGDVVDAEASAGSEGQVADYSGREAAGTRTLLINAVVATKASLDGVTLRFATTRD